MRTDAGRGTVDEGRRRRGTLEGLTPAAKPVQAGPGSVQDPSPEPVDRGRRIRSGILGGPKAKIEDAMRGRPAFPAWLGRLGYYGLALLLVGGAVLLHWALGDVLSPTPFLVFYLAWVAAAAFGGLGPGLLAMLASWLCVDLFFDPTPWHVSFHDPGSVGRLMVLLVGGLAVSVVGETMRRSRIRERRQGQELAAANAALRASEEKYRIVADNTYDWEFWLDPEDRFLYTSPSCERVTGYAAREFMSHPGLLQEIIHPEDLAAFLEHQHEIPSSRHGDIEFRIITKHDETRWIHHLCQPIDDKDGRYAGSRGSNRDITERKLAEEALRASEEKYRFLVENSKDITWTVDLQGQWTFMSSNMEKVTGYRADELIGKMLWDFLAPESRDLVKENLRRRAGGEDLPPYEVLFVGKDGRHMPFEVHAGSIVDDGGNIVGVQGVARDITERQRAEEALRESEKRYRGIVEDQTELICLFEGDATITFVNDAYCRYFGKKREELVGHKFLPLIAEADREAVKAQIAALSRENPFVTIEQRVRRPDGSIAWQEWKNRAVFDGHGHLTGYQAVGRDITERKRAEEALRESEEKFRLLAETSPAAILIYQDGKYVYANPAVESITGYTCAELLQQAPGDIVHPDDRRQVKELASRRTQGEGLPIHYEARILTKDGRERWMDNASVSILYGNKPAGLVVAFDVTERKRAQEAVAESRKKYRNLVEKINDWVWEIDADGVYTYSSPRALDLLGYAPEEIVGRTPFDLMPPAEAQRVWNAFQPIWLERKPLELLENTLVRKDGRLVTVETSGMPVFAEDGTFLGYTGIDRDVTARKWAEEQLRRSEQDLNRAQAVAKMGSWRLDVRRNELRWSQETHRIFGIPTGTPMTYETFLAAVHPAEREYVDDQWRAALRGEPCDIEYRIIVDGQLKWVRGRAELEFDEEGTLRGGFGTVQDITERKWAEEALRASQSMLQSVMENVPQGIFWKDRHSTYLGGNKVFVKAVGLESARDIIGKTDYDLPWSPEQTASFREYDRRIMESDAPEYHIIEQIREADGKLAWVETNKIPLHDAQGHVIGILGTYEDITERKRAEGALREWNATLESKVAQRTEELEHRAGQLQKLTLELTEAEERERKRLADILHDDLQQVLAAAKFQVGLLDGRVRNDAESQQIAGQAKDLLTDAIAKSRSLSHELSAPTLSQSDLGETFEWLAEQMQKKHGFTVHLDICERIELASEPLRVLLYKAAQESLFNAIKHAGVREAKLRLRHQRGRIRLSVSDEGRGFDPTEPGYNLGFGLRSIRERVEYLGGRMRIRSAVGKGSVFLITVPDAEVHEGK